MRFSLRLLREHSDLVLSKTKPSWAWWTHLCVADSCVMKDSNFLAQWSKWARSVASSCNSVSKPVQLTHSANQVIFSGPYALIRFCQGSSSQWPILLIRHSSHGLHVVTLKGHKVENGKLMLNIRDSAKDPNRSSEIWIEKNNSPNNIMNLATYMCVFFELWFTLSLTSNFKQIKLINRRK